MNASRRVLPLVAIAFGAPVLFPPDAQAYHDPASLNFILQAIVAAFVGAAIYLRYSWGKVKNRTRNLFGHKDGAEDR